MKTVETKLAHACSNVHQRGLRSISRRNVNSWYESSDAMEFRPAISSVDCRIAQRGHANMSIS